MSDCVRSGDVALLVMAVLALEALVLVIVWRFRRWGLRPAELFVSLCPGAFLATALWTALADKPWTWTALCLAAAFPAHLLDLRFRVRGNRG